MKTTRIPMQCYQTLYVDLMARKRSKFAEKPPTVFFPNVDGFPASGT